MRLTTLPALCLFACSSTPSPESVGVHRSALTYVVSSSSDSDAVDGVCTLREAWRAAVSNTVVDSCPAGGSADVIELPETWDMSLSGQDNTSLNGDLDYDGTGSIELSCLHTTCTLDAHGIDRLLHFKYTASLFSSGNPIIFKNGCANGGSCNSSATGSIPTGGAVYFNSSGTWSGENLVFETSTANNGGAFGVCAASLPNVQLTVTATDNVAVAVGGAVEAHVPWTCNGCTFDGNSAPWGGAIDQYAAEATLYDSTVTNNAATNGSGGGLFAKGTGAGNTAGAITMVGGTLTGNTATSQGGGGFAGQRWTEVCNGIGCRVTLEDVDAHGNTSAGGGGLTQGTNGLIELSGSAALEDNTDTTTPFSPDCLGTIHLYDQSVLGDATGCTVDDQRGPVCGNAEVEAGEDCDGTACCDINCAFEAAETSCSDGDSCTPSDACNGAGVCVPGGTACGDGSLNTSCSEECDDGNIASHDGCSAGCLIEACIAWE